MLDGILDMKKNPQLEKIVNTLVGATDPEQVKGLYKQWADTYDEDLDSYGYVAPKLGVAMLSDLLTNKDALIHDAGCGTGQVGALLSELGFTAKYNAVISIGVYTKRFRQHFIQEMLRITKPGGYFVFSCRELYFDEVMEAVRALMKNRNCSKLVLNVDDYMTGQGASAYYVALQKAPL